jgi:hypothetical protein
MSERMAQAIQETSTRPAVAKTGTVTAVSATTLTVLVAGTVVQAAYLASYTPVAGDLVALIRQDATWLVLGDLAGVGPNLVLNPGFEQGGATPTVPPSWFLFNEAGVSTVQVLNPGTSPPEGNFVAQINDDPSIRTANLYSSPWPVNPGETYALSAFAQGLSADTGDITLNAMGFAAITDVPPATVFNTAVASINDILQAPAPWTSISGTIVVPAGATAYMRVGLRAILAASVGMQWDFVTARRTG